MCEPCTNSISEVIRPLNPETADAHGVKSQPTSSKPFAFISSSTMPSVRRPT
jgi:hypothetical protein